MPDRELAGVPFLVSGFAETVTMMFFAIFRVETVTIMQNGFSGLRAQCAGAILDLAVIRGTAIDSRGSGIVCPARTEFPSFPIRDRSIFYFFITLPVYLYVRTDHHNSRRLQCEKKTQGY